jgi:hypothetical protein
LNRSAANVPGPCTVPQSPDAGEFRRYTRPVHVAGRVLVAIGALTLLVYLGAVAVSLNFAGRDGSAILIDFTSYWAAARLALAGDAISAFDWHSLRAASDLGPSPELPIYYWLYPPSFHLLIMPLGFLGFSTALAVFSAIGLTVWVAAVRLATADRSATANLALAAPAIAFTLVVGNTSLLWSGCLVLALATLERRREGRAGSIISLLTLKPQLGLLIPVALLCGRHYRTIAVATLGTLAAAGIGLAAFGAAYCEAFLAVLTDRSALPGTSPGAARTMVT